MNEANIETLRKFFRTSNAAFEFMEKIQVIYTNKIIIHSPMRLLHKTALDEIEKDQPDMQIMDNLIEEMERLAEYNRKK